MSQDSTIIQKHLSYAGQAVENARIIGPKIKVAAIARRSFINYMTKAVAVNRGGNLKVFSEMEPAMKWLGEE